MLNYLMHLPERLRHALRRRSLQFTISISFTLVSLVGMLSVVLLLSSKYMNAAQKMVSEDNLRVVNQVNLNLDNYLHNMMRVSNAMYYRVVKTADLATDNITPDMSLLYETNRDLLVSVALFSDDGNVIAAEPLLQLKNTVQPKEQPWFIKATQKIENLHFSTPHVQNLFVDADNHYRWVVSLSRSVELTSQGSISHGVLLVDMNFSGIEQICKNVDLGASGYIYLMDGNGEIIYHPRQQLIYSDLIHENNLLAANYEDGNHPETFEGNKRLVTVKTVGYTGWKIVSVVPMQDITADVEEIQTYSIVLMLFAMLGLVFVNLLISSRLADPIKRLENGVKELERGNLDADISVSGSYEVQHLGKTIRSMVAQMRRLMQDIVAEQEGKRKSEMDALQSQINPHFLYNTLDSIVWMVENERYEGAIKMVTALAKLFRISLSKGKNLIPVRDELEHVRNYLTIQNIRFKNTFEYEIHAQPKVLDHTTIKLIVQPLVENAIYHGIEPMGGDGEIFIDAYLVEEGEPPAERPYSIAPLASLPGLYLDVTDNGIGMLQEDADSLLSGTRQVRQRGKGSGIGLNNIQERIQLCFGTQYGLHVYSEPDEGTTVRVYLPACKTEDVPGRKCNEVP